jgi:hypothetical protein
MIARVWTRSALRPATGTLVLGSAAVAWVLWLSACGGSDAPTDTGDDPETPALADPPPDGTAAVATITQGDLSQRVGVIADDSMLGRPSPSPYLDRVAVYLASELRQAGLQPQGTNEEAECAPRNIAAVDCPYLQWFFAQPGDTVKSVNVVARLPGSDPSLRQEHVVMGAHFDHLGVGLAIAGDSIFNGADDNGSGTSTVLEVAEAFAGLSTAPRRSMLFVLFSAEERGLLGSRHFVTTPEAPMGDVTTMINLDMVGRNWTDTVAAVYQLSSDIFERAGRVADAHPELGMSLLTDPWPGENLVNRSDQAPFIPYGVPVLFLTSGLHSDYHRVSDEADRLDYEKMARLARLIFWIAWEFAEAYEPPGFPQ